MEFRSPVVATSENLAAIEYLTKNLSDLAAGKKLVQGLIEQLGNSVQRYPVWHPLLTLTPQVGDGQFRSWYDSKMHRLCDHTVYFVRGFVTCPYSEKDANSLVEEANSINGLCANRIGEPLYMDNAYPVVVVAEEIELEGDGTMRSRDAIAWFLQEVIRGARSAKVAETWWTMRAELLGQPHGSRSSLFVNQFTGRHIRKILELLNESCVFGPIQEYSLEMLSKKKRETIAETLLRSAFNSWDGKETEISYLLRDEHCKASISDSLNDGKELSISVHVSNGDLSVSGFLYPNLNRIDCSDPVGKRKLAEKFL